MKDKESLKFGPPGAHRKDPKYNRHSSYCQYLGRWISWEEYLASVNKRKLENKWGRPGAHDPDEARAHRRYCRKHKVELTWDEYRAQVRKYQRGVNAKEIGEAIRRKLEEKGLVRKEAA